MAERKKKDKIEDALLKVALGCTVEEVTEEYAEVDGELKLTKRRETKKDIPPDLKAVQMLLCENSGDVAAYSDEELEAERKRLLQELEASKKKTPTKKKRALPRKPRKKTGGAGAK
ncbi:MAG: hypothetical protein IJY62_05580 [Clostridia bacterium]|nr:hypothetical protein [Clostridia bacterium]